MCGLEVIAYVNSIAFVVQFFSWVAEKYGWALWEIRHVTSYYTGYGKGRSVGRDVVCFLRVVLTSKHVR